MTESATDHILIFGQEKIVFSLAFSPRKRLRISVHPDQRVTVLAPLEVSLERVLARVRRRAGWIIKQRHYFQQFKPIQPPRRYVSGETHLYLGRQYRLKVIDHEGPQSTKLVGPFLRVLTPNTNDEDRVKILVNRWYREHAVKTLTRRLEGCVAAVRRLGVEPSEVRFRSMKSRWGSCTPAGRITLNTELARAPVHCIDYVITHELCHLVHPHHGKEFYALLSRVMPDWERRKKRLEGVTT
jgi:hypothetical protein